jgi:hypothetical protein
MGNKDPKPKSPLRRRSEEAVVIVIAIAGLAMGMGSILLGLLVFAAYAVIAYGLIKFICWGCKASGHPHYGWIITVIFVAIQAVLWIKGIQGIEEALKNAK